MSDTKSKVLRASLLNRVMTAIQLSKIVPENKKGQVESYLVSQKGKRLYFLRSYMKVHKTLTRWEGELWKRVKQRNNDSDLWIPLEDRRRAAKPHEDIFRTANLLHDLAVSDVYAVLYNHRFENGTPVLTKWDREENSKEYEQVYYDARMSLFGHQCFLEVERGNHAILDQGQSVSKDYYTKSLNHKLERYWTMFGQLDTKPLLLITVEDWYTGSYDEERTEDLMEKVVELAGRHKFRNQVLIARHRDVIGDREAIEGEIRNDVFGEPLNDVWVSPLNPDGFTSIQKY